MSANCGGNGGKGGEFDLGLLPDRLQLERATRRSPIRRVLTRYQWAEARTWRVA